MLRLLPFVSILAGAVAVALPAAASSPTCIPAPASPCPVWVQNYDDPTLSGRPDQFPADLALSPDGTLSVIVAENVNFTGDPYSSTSAWAVVAYDTATGAERWRSNFSSGGPWDAPKGLCFSPDGSRIYVTGENYVFGSPLVVPNDAAMTTIAYDSATGARLWRATYQGPGPIDNGFVVATSPDGTQVYVAGVSAAQAGSNADLDHAVAAYSAATGAEQWTKRYGGLGSGGVNSPAGLGVDPLGRFVYVTGQSPGSAQFDIDYATVAYAIQGNTAKQAWVARYDGVGADLADDSVTGLVVDPLGRRVYVGGRSTNNTSGPLFAYGTIAYDAATGAELWNARWSGTGAGYSVPYAIALDPSGDRLFVAGQAPDPSSTTTLRNDDFATIAYSAASGSQLWARLDDQPTYNGEFARALATSPDGGRVYAAGVSSSSLQQGLSDQLTIAYSASDGTPIWKGRYNDSGLDRDSAFDIAASADGRYVVTAATFFHSNVSGSNHGNIYDAGTAAYREDSPTAAVVTGFAVRGRVVTWRTRSEVGIAGVEVFRGQRKVHRGLVVAKGAVLGASYRILDGAVHRGAAYQLRVVALDGTRRWVASARSR